jgi:hypothetical protein
LCQAGFRNCLPQWVSQLTARPEVVAYVARVLRAAKMEPPAWIRATEPALAGA